MLFSVAEPRRTSLIRCVLTSFLTSSHAWALYAILLRTWLCSLLKYICRFLLFFFWAVTHDWRPSDWLLRTLRKISTFFSFQTESSSPSNSSAILSRVWRMNQIVSSVGKYSACLYRSSGKGTSTLSVVNSPPCVLREKKQHDKYKFNVYVQ